MRSTPPPDDVSHVGLFSHQRLGSVLQGGGNPQWWHAVFPNTTCNATLCASAPDNPSNKKCCAACLAAKNCGQLTNTTDYDVLYPEWATPDHDSNGHKLYGYRSMPPDKKTAYELYRDYYNSRIAWITSVGDQPYSKLAQVNSVTCVSHMELCKQPRKSPKCCFLCWCQLISERVVGQTQRCGIRRARTSARR